MGFVLSQGICVQYAVPLAIINGKQLAELSMESMAMGGEPVPMEDLLSCVKNIQQVAAVLQQPGRRYKGPGGTSAVRPYIPQYHTPEPKTINALPARCIAALHQAQRCLDVLILHCRQQSGSSQCSVAAKRVGSCRG